MHFPVYNKAGEIVVSSVTTLDVHDVARIAKTYGAHSFYVVTPLETQLELVERMVAHWVEGYGAEYNPTRKQALLETRLKRSLADVVQDIEERLGTKPKTVVTDAKKFSRGTTYKVMREELEQGDPHLLVFGTGWGLEKSIIENADHVLDPIEGAGQYNHLPVRAAIAIILDRLAGER